MMTKMKSLILALMLACSLFMPCAAYADETSSSSTAQLWHITDAADILTDAEDQDLENQADAIEAQYDFGVYVVIVDNYRDFSSVSVFDAATSIYEEYTLGVGSERDGLMLLLSMSDRDFSLIAHGEGNYAFNDEGRAIMTDAFLDDFSADAWYDGLSDFMEYAEIYLKAASEGEPISSSDVPMTKEDAEGALVMYLLAVLLIPAVVAFVTIKVMDAKMRSVAAATHASEYMAGELQLTESLDHYSHTTQTVIRVESDNEGAGGRGGFTTSHGGGFSGTSGKF